jgi:hypothetical protein
MNLQDLFFPTTNKIHHRRRAIYRDINYIRTDTDKPGSFGRTILAVEEFLPINFNNLYDKTPFRHRHPDDQESAFHALINYSESNYHTHIVITTETNNQNEPFVYITFVHSLREAREFATAQSTIYRLSTMTKIKPNPTKTLDKSATA